MAHHVIIECNLDLAHTFRDDPRFAENLYLALGHRHINNERILKNYGIKVLNEHHSSDCKEVVVKRDAAPESSEELKDALMEICRLCVRLNPQHKDCTSCADMDERRRVLNKAEGKEVEK